MNTNLYWVDAPALGRVALMPRPRGGDWLEDEVLAWKKSGVDIVVSLLTPGEVSELDLTQEEYWCRLNGIRFHSWPIVDRSVPGSQAAFSEMISSLAKHSAEGKSIAIHCRQGIGRAALVAICLLIEMGFDATRAIELVSTARGVAVPETADQRSWVFQFARSSANPL